MQSSKSLLPLVLQERCQKKWQPVFRFDNATIKNPKALSEKVSPSARDQKIIPVFIDFAVIARRQRRSNPEVSGAILEDSGLSCALWGARNDDVAAR